LKKALFPPGYKYLEDKDLSPFLQMKNNKKAFFTIPAIEASINSRWYQAMKYWIRPLGLYAIFLILFTTIPQYILFQDKYNTDDKLIIFSITGIGVFYYIGLYLLIIEYRQIMKYKFKYITIFNLFDLCSIILGIIIFSLSISVNRTDIGELIVYLFAITTLIFWVEMVCFDDFINFNFLNNFY
jgi:hypothetical protein